jgi:hypothetical protein
LLLCTFAFFARVYACLTSFHWLCFLEGVLVLLFLPPSNVLKSPAAFHCLSKACPSLWFDAFFCFDGLLSFLLKRLPLCLVQFVVLASTYLVSALHPRCVFGSLHPAQHAALLHTSLARLWLSPSDAFLASLVCFGSLVPCPPPGFWSVSRACVPPFLLYLSHLISPSLLSALDYPCATASSLHVLLCLLVCSLAPSFLCLPFLAHLCLDARLEALPVACQLCHSDGDFRSWVGKLLHSWQSVQKAAYPAEGNTAAHDTSGFYGSWLPKIFPGSYAIGV